MNEKSFQFWCLCWAHQGWPTVWEVIASQKGFDVIMAAGKAGEILNKPVIMEAEYGKGKFVMMALAPDKYYIAGDDNHTKKMAGLFMENLLEAYLSSLSVEAEGKLATVWGRLKKTF